MLKIHLNFVHNYTDRHGKERSYFRQGKRKVTLTARPIGGLEWQKQYHAALAGQSLPAGGSAIGSGNSPAGSINAMIAAYLGSREWRGLGPRVKAAYKLPFEFLRENVGSASVAALRRRQVLDLLNEQKTAGAHNNLLNAIRKVINTAIDQDLRDDDPTVKITKQAGTNPFGRVCWTVEQIEQYRARHPIGSMARLALEIGYATGLRISDICRLGREHLRDGGKLFEIVPEKTKKHGTIVAQPIDDPQLVKALGAAPVRGKRPFLCSATGKDFQPHSLGDYFEIWCREAGLPHECRAHGLRKACAVRLSHNGASTHEIMAWIGDLDPGMVELYTKARDKRLLSASAAAKVRA